MAQSHELIGEVRAFDEALHAMHAGVSEVKDRLTARDQTNANVRAGCSRKSAQFHGAHFSTSNPFSEVELPPAPIPFLAQNEYFSPS